MTADDLATFLAGLPDEALIPVGWLRTRLRTPGQADPGEPVRDLSCADVATALDRKPGTVRAWCARGEIPGAYLLNHREWRIPRAALRAYLDRQGNQRTTGNADAAGSVDLGSWRRYARRDRER